MVSGMSGGVRTRVVPAVVAVLVVLATATAPVSLASGSATYSCREINGHKYCIVDVWSEQDDVAPGESVTVHAVVENQGSKTGSINSYLGVRRPDGSKHYPSGDEAYDIAIGERVELEYATEIPSDAQEGDYEITVDVWTGNDAEMFDTSGWRQALSVAEPTTSAAITGTSASGTYEPGDAVPVDVTVENTGDTTHEFYVDASLQRPNGAWVTGEGTTVDLRPGEQRSLTLDARVPDDASEGSYSVGSGVFYSSAKDDQYEYGLDRDAVTVEASNSAPSASRDGPSRDVTIDQGATVTFAVDADDPDGNLAGTEWYVDGELADETQWIDGSSDTAEFSRTFDEPGTYTVEGAVFDGERAYSSLVSWTVTVEELSTDAAISRIDADGGPHAPGESVPVDLTVENTGETTHEFYADASLQRPNGNWVTGEGTSVRLQPGERRSLTLDVRVPDTARDGSYDVGAGVFRSSAKDDGLGGAQERDAFVVEAPTADVAIVDRRVAGEEFSPGETVPVEVTVANDGEATGTFYADASLRPPGENWRTGEGRTVELSAGDERTLTLDVALSDDATVGSYDAGAAVYRSATKDDAVAQTTIDGAFSVAGRPDVAIVDADVPGETYRAGDTVPADVTVENDGTGAATIALGFSVEGVQTLTTDEWELDRRGIRLQPGERRTIAVEGSVPESATVGAYDAAFTLGTVDESGDVERVDSDRARDEITVASEVVTIESVDVTPERPGVGERATVTVTLSAAIAGGADATVQVGLGDQRSSRTVAVPASGTETIELGVTVPDEPEPELTVTAEPADGRTVTRSRTLGTAANATLSGRVLDADGDPVTDAIVEIDGRAFEVDRDGRFRATDLPAGQIDITAVAGDVRRTRSVRLERGGDRSIEIRTGSAGAITDVDAPPTYTPGEPISVAVTVRNDGESTATFTLDLTGSEPRTAEVRPITVPAGETERVSREVVPQTADGSPDVGVELRSEDGTVVDERAVELSETPTLVQVTVTDSDGEPVPGVAVGTGLDGPKTHTTNEAGVATLPLTTPTTTFGDADEPADSWTTIVSYEAEEYGVDNFQQVEVRRGTTTRTTVDLPSRSQVGGRVTTDGERLTDVQVFVGEQSAFVQSNGRFTIDEGLSPGSYYIRVKKNDAVVLNTVKQIETGYTNLHLEVPHSRYESATGLDNYVSSVVSQAISDDQTAAVRDEIYGDVTESDMTLPQGGSSEHYVTDDGSYYTSGPCAWYNSEEQCAASKVTTGGTESTSRALNEGIVSGFVTGGEETIEGFKQLLKPIEYLGQLFSLAMQIVRDLGLIEELIAALPGQVVGQQQQDNPYESGTPENETFANGWYGGYGSFLLISSVASGGSAGATSKALSTTSKFNKVASKAKGLTKSKKIDRFRRRGDDRGDTGGAPDALDDLDPDTREQLQSLRQSGALGSFLTATGQQGAKLLNRLDGPTASRTIRQYNAGRLDSDAIRRTNRLLDAGDMDQADYQRLLGLLETKADDPLLDRDLDSDDLLDVAESNGDLSETRWAVRADQSVEGLDDEIVWLEEGVPGDDGTGYQHIIDKHESDITGKYDGVDDTGEVEALVNQALKNPDRTMLTSDGKAVFVYRVSEGEKPLTVVVGSNGFVQSAYPQQVGG
ncbi:carboxypeptidase regulatory-like domain-containing protein [Halomicrobium sp. IBSBa]|uniref:NEW3 domain-containing protein n=1 Tax=Halomicrobium sp. IBSBa TaxID=2778916 RepID=UPI001ABF5391|nr:NEW3 domain-containing protein [Halomicrobium sp. IBSBa]MBO4247370.1 carboxypeptidase regulatory-like domain-containing protein [Halomicrobium sp. IBSBa]